ncbi:tryptophan-rich sensory protein [Protaetiibacter sp. SSC-01]|nr:tryptophan-rich sensory protein [Protaetiibacter sp. SSC-01]
MIERTSRPSDIARQVAVISAAAFMIIAALVGTGIFGGTPVEDLQDGKLSAEYSFLAPAQQAFSIWSVIYVGLLAYTVRQALPGQRASERQRALGWWIALSMVLNGLWLVFAQFTTLLLTVIGIVALLVVLCIIFRIAVGTREAGGGVLDSLLIDGANGLHLGWVTLATVANTTAFLTDIAPDAWGDAATPVGIVVLVVVGLIGVAIASFSRGRVAPALALTWGLSWLAVGRLAGEPESTGIGITAIVIAVVVLLSAIIVRFARGRAPTS